MYKDIETIWEHSKSSLMQFIMSKVQNKYDAEDILQDVFLKLYKNIDRIEDASKIRSYIYKIAKHTISDYYRKRKDTVMETESLSEQIILEKGKENLNTEIAACLKGMIDTLPEKYQEPINLYDIMGNKHKDISDKLHISISGSKTRVQRGRRKLKELLLDCCDFQFDVMGNIIDYRQKKNCKCDQL